MDATRQPRICAIITARGGSKGLKDKNILELNGIPLIAHSIKAGLECSKIDRCIVSTDSPMISELATAFGAEVIIRPPELATDSSRSEDAIEHALDQLAKDGYIPDHFVLLQPTSPLRTEKHISEALGMYLNKPALSCMSVTECEHHPYKSFIIKGGAIEPLFGKEFLSVPRQSLPNILRQNGAIYIVSTPSFTKQKSFFIEPALFYMMDRNSSIDIDTELDFSIASFFMDRN